MHVAGDRVRNDVRAVVVVNIEYVMAFVLIGADEFRVQRDMIGEQGVGHDTSAAAEIFTRVARLDRRLGRSEFLAVDGAEQETWIEGVKWKDGQRRDEIADSVAGFPQRGEPDVLTGGLRENMIRNIACFGHSAVAASDRAGENGRRQAVFTGDFSGVARLQAASARREKPQWRFTEVKDVGDAALRQRGVKALARIALPHGLFRVSAS